MQEETPTIELRSTLNRPVYKLSVRLIDTYKYINKVYYEAKALKLRDQKDSARCGVHNDGYDDQNYDYILRGEELFNDRYLIKHKMGKGSFGQVVSAYDQEKKMEVAIKIIKSRKPFQIQAKTEIDILNKVNEKDENDESNIVKLIDQFMFRNHQCLVFEILSFNLYELLKNTKFRGVSLSLIRKFSRHLLKSLEFLSRPDVDIIHCDLKPENILLRHPRRSAIKLIDFGSSCYLTKRAYSYIQSRFYRSPEVLLGLPYTQKIDMWSLGCVCVEMHTGEPLFGGANQADQICRIVDVLGMPPLAMIKASPDKVRTQFFEKVQAGTDTSALPTTCDMNCVVHEEDGSAYYVLKRTNRDGPKPRTVEEVVGVHTGGPSGRRAGEPDHSPLKYMEFVDFVKSMLVYEPTERASAADLLNHAYVMALSTDNPTSTATSVVGSGGGTAGSSLVGDPTNTAGSSGLLGAGQQQIHQHQHHQKETVTVVEAGCSSDPAAAVPTEDNLKDVLRGRRADLPDGAAKIRSQSAPGGSSSVRLFSNGSSTLASAGAAAAGAGTGMGSIAMASTEVSASLDITSTSPTSAQIVAGAAANPAVSTFPLSVPAAPTVVASAAGGVDSGVMNTDP